MSSASIAATDLASNGRPPENNRIPGDDGRFSIDNDGATAIGSVYVVTALRITNLRIKGTPAVMAGLALVVLLAAGCATVAVVATPQPTPTFDIAAVRANFTDECKDPAAVDDLFCTQVEIGGMSANGEILNVPTTLAPEARDRGDVICRQLVFAHFDDQGRDLGYQIIGILDRAGGHLAACSV